MNNSLQQHGLVEVAKQVRLRMKNSGLADIKVEVTRRAGKIQVGFVGTPDGVAKANVILANWD